MSITVGQIPHFDISTVNFSPIGSTYLTGAGPGSAGSKIVILYGSSSGAKRKKIALRRYVYQYLIEDNFSFVTTYKGVRNRSVLPSYVGDTNDLNNRTITHGIELPLEPDPTHITQTLLKSLFLYPNFQDYFFLDCTVPAMIGLVARHIKQFAVRFSEVEPLESVMVWAGKAQWVWVDCFTQFVLTKEIEERLHAAGFKICLVSPELQGRHLDIRPYIERCRLENIEVDAVCTKAWQFSHWATLQNL